MQSRRFPFLMLALSATVSASLACSALGGEGDPQRSTPGSPTQAADAGPATEQPAETDATAELDEQPPLPPADGQNRDDALADQGAWMLSGYDLDRYGPIGDIAFEGGRVLLTSTTEYAWAWAVYAGTYAGVTLSVDVTKLAESDASPGLICNYRSEQDFYYATVGSFGVYTVTRYTDGLYETVLEGGSSQSGSVLPDGQTNRIELTCADDQISLSVNGEALGSAPAPTGGQIGLMLETFSDAATDARFENLVIRVIDRLDRPTVRASDGPVVRRSDRPTCIGRRLDHASRTVGPSDARTVAIQAGRIHPMPPASGHVEIISAGRITVDYGIGPGGETILERPGGSAVYSAVGARLWNEHVGILGRVGCQYPDGWLARFEEQGLSSRGVRVMDEPFDHRDAYVYTSATERTGERLAQAYAGHERDVPPELEGFVPYTETKEDRSRFSPLAVRPSETPRSYLHARAAHVAPCELVTQTALPASLRRSGLSYITLAPHSRFMKPEFAVDVKQVVLGLDAFIPRDSDVRSFFEEAELQGDMWQAAEAFAAMGARSVIIRQGLRGLSAYDARQNKRWHVQAYTAKVKEPTGAGDAFAGGFVAGLLAYDDILEAALCGSVSASLAMEGSDPFYALGATPGLADARREALRAGVREI